MAELHSDADGRRLRPLPRATQMGADLALDAREDVVGRLKAETDGNGVDIVLEMSGSAAALHQGLAAVTNGGRVSLLGTHATPATLDLSQEVIFKGIRVYGITGRRLWDTWYRTTALLEEGLDVIIKLLTSEEPVSSSPAPWRARLWRQIQSECARVVFESG